MRQCGGFTLMELATVIVIISILAVLSIQGYAALIYRAQGVNCTNNLRNLYAACSSYVQDNQTWPQIPTTNADKPAFAQAWINALAPYKIQAVNWICPSIQRLLGNPDYTQPQNVRIDYGATPFPPGLTAPTRYPTQPWFAESASVHGDGNLIIYANGDLKTLNQVITDMAQPQLAPN
jgi:prepilin-type N-terminal cleavage/methylation domain-containing protein